MSETGSAWLGTARFGLFVHWHENSAPESGPRRTFAEAVARFPVAAFADQVAEAGAEYVIFTVTHVRNEVPFPLPALDRLLPGRTCRRDLMAELHQALAARGIRLLFYFSWQAQEDPEFGAVTGWQQDLRRWQDTMNALVAAIGERYGERLAGWWIDNCRPDKWDRWMAGYDFAAMADALRVGGPGRALAFNISGPAPPVPPPHDHQLTGIADFVAGHLAHELLVADGPTDANGLRSHWCNNMDTQPKWFFGGDNRKLRFSDRQAADWAVANAARGALVSYGVAPTQDGELHPGTRAQLAVVRQALAALG